VVHEFSVEVDEAEYEAMVETYSTTGEKEWIEAVVSIDGVTYEQVGMRLKGNSSLRGLGGFGRGQEGGSGSSDQPQTLPWLIRLDEFVEGQNHDGLVELVVRSNNSATALNEAVALDLLEAAGLASQDSAYATFTVNGSNQELRLVMENPDDVWMADAFTSEGVLYKAEATGDYSYRGDGPEAYDEVFDIEAGKDNGDLTPLIEFLDFINNSDDDSFDATLSEYLDVESFATYLALQDLMNNFDDIDGPGNNSYLYYNTETGMFTVVPWDHNLAFGTGLGPGRGIGQDPPGEGGFGPGVGGPFGGRPGGGGPLGGAEDGGTLAGAGGPRGRSNILVERFLANPEWQELYDAAAARLQTELFDNGIGLEILEKWTTVLESQATNLVTADQVSEEAAAIASQL
jgi:spore coat protein CotH